MSKGKKNMLVLLGLGALLAVCIVLYALIPQGTEKDTEEDTKEAAQPVTVDTIDSEKITSLKVSADGKNSLDLVKEGDAWKLAENKKAPVDSEAVAGLFTCLNPVQAAKTLEKKEDSLAEYGLDNPAMTIQVSTEDGGEYQYKLGDAVPVEGGYYGMDAAEEKIYCLSENLYTTFDIDSNTLIKKEELPEIAADNMTYILVDNKEGRDFEAKVVSAKEQVDAYSKWNITKPYEKPLATSTKNWTSTQGYFSSLTFEELIEYGSSSLKSYGLQDPAAVITVKYYVAKDGYTPEATATPAADAGTDADRSSGQAEIPEKYREYKTLQICIGEKQGESYYVCQKGSDNVYTMSASSVENMIHVDPYESMDHCVYSTLATDIKGYEASYGDTTLKITRTPIENGGDAGQGDVSESEKPAASGSGSSAADTEKNNNIWKVNGTQVSAEDEETFLTPYSSLYLLEFTARAKDSVKPKSHKPVLTMVYHEDDRDVTVKYLPYDGTNFYRVDKDGMDYFLVDKRSVDDVIKMFDDVKKLA